MSNRNTISIIDPDGIEKEVSSFVFHLLIGVDEVIDKETAAKRIVHHFAKIQYCEREDLQDILRWPRTYKIVMFDFSEFDVTIGAQKTIQLFVDNEEE
jgi:hypothetical protein